MTVKRTVRKQYQAIVDGAAVHIAALRSPSEGWRRTARKGLGMSGAQLARKMGVTRARIANAEKAEVTGSVTLKSMEAAAKAMGCRFVYAIVPPNSVADLIEAQARKKASVLVGTASKHMALEGQTLSRDQIAQQIAHVTQDLAHEMPSDFWDDK
jgi:predicted DNA-binding mobile mystery protein A